MSSISAAIISGLSSTHHVLQETWQLVSLGHAEHSMTDLAQFLATTPPAQTIGIPLPLVIIAMVIAMLLALVFVFTTRSLAKRQTALGKILAMASTQRRTLALATLCQLFANVCRMPTQFLFGQFIDLVTVHKAEVGGDAVKKELPLMFTWLLASMIGASILGAVSGALFGLAGERVTRRMRAMMFRKLIAQETAFFDSHQSGEWLNRLSADAQTVQAAATTNLANFVSQSATIIMSVMFCLFTSWRLFCVILVLLPFMMVIGKILGSKMKVLSKEYQDSLAKAGATAGETLSCIRTIRLFASGEGKQIARYEHELDNVYGFGRKRAIVSGGYGFLISLVSQLAISGSLLVGTFLVVDGAMQLGSLTAFLMYGMQAAGTVSSMVNLYSSMSSAIGASNKIFEIVERCPSIPSTICDACHSLLAPDKCDGGIVFQDVSFAYSKSKSKDESESTASVHSPEVTELNTTATAIELGQPVLKSMSFVAVPGEVLALCGPSGGGKSTVVSLILRLYDPLEGKVTLDGNDLRDLDPRWLKRQMAAVSQEPILFSTSIRENIAYGAKTTPSDADIQAAAQQANAHEFITQLADGYASACGERGVRLSGGQKQRIAIARALLLQPRVLVLDEATSALDAESEHLVQGALDSILSESMGRPTIIVVAHRLSTIRGADKLLVLQDGRVVEEGNHSELMQVTGGLYAKLATRQLEGAEALLQD